jgi:hypothetical protein
VGNTVITLGDHSLSGAMMFIIFLSVIIASAEAACFDRRSTEVMRFWKLQRVGQDIFIIIGR